MKRFARARPNRVDAAAFRRQLDEDLQGLEPALRVLMLRKVVEVAAEHTRRKVTAGSQVEQDHVLARCAKWAIQLRYPNDLDGAPAAALAILVGRLDDISVAHRTLISFRFARDGAIAIEKKLSRQEANFALDIPVDYEWRAELRKEFWRQRDAAYEVVKGLGAVEPPSPVGGVLGSALDVTFRRSRPEKWLAVLCRKFKALSATPDMVVPLDSVTAHLVETTRPITSGWEHDVDQRFREVALPTLSRDQPLTNPAALRLAAISLQLPEVAAGITLLEQTG